MRACGLRARDLVVIIVSLGGMLLCEVVHGELAPLSDDEVYPFLTLFGLAMKQCDMALLEEDFLPSSRLTFHTSGEPPVTVGIKEYLNWFRGECWHMNQSFDVHSVSVQVNGYHATVHNRSEKGIFSHYFFLPAAYVKSVDETIELIRYHEGIRISSVYQLLVPEPEGSDTPHPPAQQRRP